jgi:hypothetical protein
MRRRRSLCFAKLRYEADSAGNIGLSAVCFVGGRADAGVVASRMLDRLPASERKIVSIGPNMALGGNWHPGTPGGRAPRQVRPELWVAVDGEVFDDTGLAPDIHAIFAEIYDHGDPADYAQLDGSFAAIIVDAAREIVTLAADRFATRPLYYWASGQKISAASRVLMVLADERVPRNASRQGLIELFTHQRTFGARTLYRSIWGLVNGHVVRLTKRGEDVTQPTRLRWRGDAHDPRATAEALAAAWTSAVRRRTSDSAKPMLLLSGGLDSRIVLAAGCAASTDMSCVTICPWRSPEVRVAESVARAARCGFSFLQSDPESFSDLFEQAVDWTDGMFPAPLSLFRTDKVLAGYGNVALTGHSLDIMFRATYQPKRSVRLLHSNMSLPMHRAVRDGSAATLMAEHHIHTERGALASAVETAAQPFWAEAEREGITGALTTVEFSDPYDAFHAFCFHAQGRHHSNADFVGLAPVLEYRVIAFDRKVAEIYLGMPSRWRVQGHIAYKAMRLLSRDLFRIPDANTGLRGDLGPWSRIFMGLGRAASRRLINKLPERPPADWLTLGSWVDWSRFFRTDPKMRTALLNLKNDSTLRDLGLFSPAGLSTAIDAHMAGQADYHKFLRLALGTSTWFKRHGYSSVA